MHDQDEAEASNSEVVQPFARLKLAYDNTNKDWLSELQPGTTFVCREKGKKEVDLQLYIVVFKGERMVFLEYKTPDSSSLKRYVDPKLFSEKHELFEILGVQDIE